MSATQMLPPVVGLSVVSPSKTRALFQLRSDHSVFIGTSGNCGLPLSGEGISDIHCYVKFEDGKLWVEDWMSKSGTLINGERISTRVEVQLGDIIQVGSHQVALQDAAQSIPPPVVKPVVSRAENLGDDEVDYENASINRAADQDSGRFETPITAEPVECKSTDEPVTWPGSHASSDCFDAGIFEGDEVDTYDKETVALLRAEIEHLQAALALAQRDAHLSDVSKGDHDAAAAGLSGTDDAPDPVLARMQELIEEANRSDERVTMLEELLLAAQIANGAEQEERIQLEAWIDDIEQRLAQREVERQAEVEMLHERLTQAGQMQERLVQQLRQATGNQRVPPNYHEHLEQLQQDYQKSQHELAESRKQCAKLQQRLSQAAEEPQRALREERVRLAEEQNQVAKLKLQLSSKLTTLRNSAEPENCADTSADHRIKALSRSSAADS